MTGQRGFVLIQALIHKSSQHSGVKTGNVVIPEVFAGFHHCDLVCRL